MSLWLTFPASHPSTGGNTSWQRDAGCKISSRKAPSSGRKQHSVELMGFGTIRLPSLNPKALPSCSVSENPRTRGWSGLAPASPDKAPWGAQGITRCWLCLGTFRSQTQTSGDVQRDGNASYVEMDI